jgi:hypothetical protein
MSNFVISHNIVLLSQRMFFVEAKNLPYDFYAPSICISFPLSSESKFTYPAWEPGPPSICWLLPLVLVSLSASLEAARPEFEPPILI